MLRKVDAFFLRKSQKALQKVHDRTRLSKVAILNIVYLLVTAPSIFDIILRNWFGEFDVTETLLNLGLIGTGVMLIQFYCAMERRADMVEVVAWFSKILANVRKSLLIAILITLGLIIFLLPDGPFEGVISIFCYLFRFWVFLYILSVPTELPKGVERIDR